jgi:DNA-directed RNA polymerase subunit RPC12/RpoP
MRYYCKRCNAEIRLPKDEEAKRDENGDVLCPLCQDDIFSDEPPAIMSIIPDYETHIQYKKRTGKLPPDDTAVWVLFTDGKWKLHYYKQFKIIGGAIVIADPPVPPPDNWRPE